MGMSPESFNESDLAKAHVTVYAGEGVYFNPVVPMTSIAVACAQFAANPDAYVGLSLGIGINALANITPGSGSAGRFNLAIGAYALNTATTGHNNTAIGLSSLQSVTTGNDNCGLGINAGLSITSGAHNLAVGNQSIWALTTGSWNVMVGQYTNTGGAPTSTLTTGSSNILIGSGNGTFTVDTPTSSTSNFLNIGGAIYGTSINTGGTTAAIGINQISPQYALDVIGSVNYTGTLTTTGQTNGSGANTATLTNSPVTGNPNFWIPIQCNGTLRHFPVW